MQDRYAGDVGDFGKYGLLRALCAEELTWGSRAYDLSLGVVWYLVPDEEGTGDGGHISWLGQDPDTIRNYMPCDPDLYHRLLRIIREDDRSVRAVRERGVLPEGTAFYEEVLSFEGTQDTRERLERRRSWVRGAFEAVAGCDVVFADPDNGLERERMSPCHDVGPKYAYYDELSPYLERGQSLVVFQSRDRDPGVADQVAHLLPQIRERLGSAFAVFHRPHAGRTFFVVLSESHRDTLIERAERLTRHPRWSRHFTLRGMGDSD